MIGKQQWPGNYSEPEDFMMEVDIQINLDLMCMTRVQDMSHNEKFISILMKYAPKGEKFEKKEKSVADQSCCRNIIGIQKTLTLLNFV